MTKNLFPGYSHAECRGDYEHFGFNKKTALNMEMCNRCAVSDACWEYSLKNERYGIWSGRNGEDREQYRKAHNIPTPPLLGYERIIYPVNVKITNAKSAQRMRDMKWRKAEQTQTK